MLGERAQLVAVHTPSPCLDPCRPISCVSVEPLHRGAGNGAFVLMAEMLLWRFPVEGQP